MLKTGSTYKILFRKRHRLASVEDWIDWAIEQLTDGIESEHLILLAGMLPSENRFRFDDILDKTLNELDLQDVPEKELLQGYMYHLLNKALAGEMPLMTVLYELNDLRLLATVDDESLIELSMLYYAKDDLKWDTVQFYWHGADRSNIDGIIRSEFRRWLDDYEEGRMPD